MKYPKMSILGGRMQEGLQKAETLKLQLYHPKASAPTLFNTSHPPTHVGYYVSHDVGDC